MRVSFRSVARKFCTAATFVGFVFCVGTSHADTLSCPSARHLATIETTGEISLGSDDAVIAAYRAGASLRLGWELDFNADGQTDISHWADATFLSEFQGIVSAQVNEIERQSPKRDGLEFNDTPQRWSGLLSTDGSLLGRFSDGAQKRRQVRSVWCRQDDPAACHHQWRLLYHHDAEGQAISGDKKALFDAIRHGRPLRLTWGLKSARDSNVTVEHVAEPVFVTATGGEVAAQLPEHIAQQSYGDPDRARFAVPGVMWRGLMSTSGTFDAVWVDRATGDEVRRVPQRAAIAWYAFGPGTACDSTPLNMAIPGGVRRDTAVPAAALENADG